MPYMCFSLLCFLKVEKKYLQNITKKLPVSTFIRNIKKLLFIITLTTSILNIFGQSKPTGNLQTNTQKCASVDVIDIYKKIVHKPARDSCEEAEKNDELHLAILPAFGYSLVTKLAGVVAGTIAFYT